MPKYWNDIIPLASSDDWSSNVVIFLLMKDLKKTSSWIQPYSHTTSFEFDKDINKDCDLHTQKKLLSCN